MKYAVYVVVIEDSEETDQSLATGVDSLERVRGDLTLEQAVELVDDMVMDTRP